MSLRKTLILALALTSAIAIAAPASAAKGGKGLARNDKDGDGKISLQEFLTARGRIFDRIDANHDGQVTKDEVAAFQIRMENAAAGAMIRSGRERGEGGKQLERVAELTADGPLTRARWDAMMTKRFERLDVGHAGFISLDQMRAGRRGEAAPVTEPAADPMTPAAPKS